MKTQQTWELYAKHYDAMIQATEAERSTLPSLHEIGDASSGGMMERLVNPPPFETNWNLFHNQLKETDARLRLASLQVVLRHPSAQTTVPNRLAEVGSSYYDPFSGLPMLWSPTRQKIYSVGKDHYDDGGDTGFDISVPAIVTLAAAPKESHPPAPPSRPNRR